MKHILILVGLSLIMFFRTIFYGYVSDDLGVESTSKPRNLFTAIWEELCGKAYYNKKRVHCITIILHTIACCLIYEVFGRNELSLLTAILFLVSTANAEVSVWVSGKPYLYYTIILLSLMNMARSLNLYVLLLLPFFLFPILGIALRKKIEQNSPFATKEGRSLHWRKAILFLKSYGYYFRILLVPWKMGFYHKVGTGVGLTKKYTEEAYEIDSDFWWGLSIFYVVITNMLFNRDQPQLVNGLIWFTIWILPFCNILSLGQGIAMRYAYIANIGLMYSLSYILLSLRPEIIYWVVGAYMIRTWFYIRCYRSEFWYAEAQIFEQPKYYRGWLRRGIKKFKAQDYSGALLDFIEATECCPHDAKSNFNVAYMYLATGDIVHAEEYLETAKENIYQNGDKKKMEEMIAEAEAKIEAGKRDGRFKLEKLYVMK